MKYPIAEITSVSLPDVTENKSVPAGSDAIFTDAGVKGAFFGVTGKVVLV